MEWKGFTTALLVLILLISGCATPAPREGSGQPASSSNDVTRTAAPTRVAVAIRGEPRTISTKIDSSPSVPGGADVETMLHAGTGVVDADGKLRPQLAEAIPSVENGLWQVQPDGTMETTWRIKPNARWHDGQPVTAEDLLSLADAWQRIGVAVDPVVLPPQRQRDLPYRATFPAFDMQRQPSRLNALYNLYSYEARLPETNFVGRNYSRYMNPQLDSLLDRYFTTVPWPARMEVGKQIAHLITDQLVWIDLFYDAQPVMVSNRIKNVLIGQAAGAQDTWNIHEWEL